MAEALGQVRVTRTIGDFSVLTAAIDSLDTPDRRKRALMRHLEGREDAKSRWVRAVHERRGFHKAAVALAAKNARIVWALLARGAEYRVA